MLQITLTAPTISLSNFYKEIRLKAKEKFNIPYHSKITPLIPAKAAYLYDAVYIYAKAATKMLEQNLDLRDGKTLMQKFIFNNTFMSKQGFEVFFYKFQFVIM
jgi:hypothetical protein